MSLRGLVGRSDSWTWSRCVNDHLMYCSSMLAWLMLLLFFSQSRVMQSIEMVQAVQDLKARQEQYSYRLI
jgi:hypothetical protein